MCYRAKGMYGIVAAMQDFGSGAASTTPGSARATCVAGSIKSCSWRQQAVYLSFVFRLAECPKRLLLPEGTAVPQLSSRVAPISQAHALLRRWEEDLSISVHHRHKVRRQSPSRTQGAGRSRVAAKLSVCAVVSFFNNKYISVATKYQFPSINETLKYFVDAEFCDGSACAGGSLLRSVRPCLGRALLWYCFRSWASISASLNSRRCISTILWLKSSILSFGFWCLYPIHYAFVWRWRSWLRIATSTLVSEPSVFSDHKFGGRRRKDEEGSQGVSSCDIARAALGKRADWQQARPSYFWFSCSLIRSGLERKSPAGLQRHSQAQAMRLHSAHLLPSALLLMALVQGSKTAEIRRLNHLLFKPLSRIRSCGNWHVGLPSGWQCGRRAWLWERPCSSFHQPLERGCLVIKTPLRWDPCVKKLDVFLSFKDLLNPQAPLLTLLKICPVTWELRKSVVGPLV